MINLVYIMLHCRKLRKKSIKGIEMFGHCRGFCHSKSVESSFEEDFGVPRLSFIELLPYFCCCHLFIHA